MINQTSGMPGKTNYCLGLRDWDRGHYRDGLEFLKLSAGWGNKMAQYTLGLIYYNGHHVPVNPALGLAWLKLADQRHNDAQIDLVTRFRGWSSSVTVGPLTQVPVPASASTR